MEPVTAEKYRPFPVVVEIAFSQKLKDEKASVHVRSGCGPDPEPGRSSGSFPPGPLEYTNNVKSDREAERMKFREKWLKRGLGLTGFLFLSLVGSGCAETVEEETRDVAGGRRRRWPGLVALLFHVG